MLRALRGLVGVLVLLALVVAAAFGLAQTRAGKDRLAAAITALASDDATRVTIGRIDGLVPFDFAVERVAVADGDGDWLALDRVAVRWRARALLAGTLRLESLTAAAIRLARLPASEAGGGAPTDFELPLAVAIDDLDFPSIELGPAVAGAPATLAMSGRAGLDSETGVLGVSLAVERRDGVPGRLALDVAYGLDDRRLSLEAKLDEPPGGVIAGLLGAPDSAIAVEAHGAGTLDDWTGRAHARLGDLADLAVEAALAPGNRFTVEAKADAAALVRIYDPRFAELIEQGVALSAAGVGATGTIALDRLYAASGGTSLTVSGSIEPRAASARLAFEAALGEVAALYLPDAAALAESPVVGSLDATYEAGTLSLAAVDLAAGPTAVRASGTADLDAAEASLEVDAVADDLARLSTLAGVALAGSASAAGRLEGPLDSLAFRDAHLAARTASVAGVGLAALDGVVTVAADRPWADPDAKVVFEGGGTVEGLTAEDVASALDALTGARAEWAVAGSAPLAGDSLALTSVSITGEGVHARGEADLADDRLEARLDVALPSLARLRSLAGIDLDGSFEGEARPRIDLDSGAVTAVVSGVVTRFASDLPGVAVAVGKRARVSAMLTVADSMVRLRELAVDGGPASLWGGIDIAGSELGGDLRLDLYDLGAFSSLAGAPLAGRAAFAARLGGTVAAPALGLSFSAADVIVAGAPPFAATGWLTAGDLNAPAGAFSMALSGAGVEVTVTGEHALTGERLSLRALDARGAGIALAGGVEVALDEAVATGRLEGRADELAPLGALLGVDLAGSASFRAELLGARGLRAAVSARALALAGVDLAEAELTAEGAFDTLDLSLRTEGRALDAPLAVEGAGRLSLAPGGATLDLARLAGTYAEAPFALERPAAVTVANGAVRIEAFALALAGGRVEGGFALSETAPSGRLVVTGVPVGLALAGADGTLEADARLDGAGSPEGTLHFAVSDLGLHDERGNDLPPLQVSGEAQWSDGLLVAEASATGVEGASVAARVSLPLVLEPGALVPLPVEGGRLAGRVSGTADLGRIAPLVVGASDRLAGRLELELDVADTLAAPQASGRLAIADGLYENGTAGTLVTDLALALEGDGRRVVVRRLEARDGGEGSLSGSGGIELDPPAFPIDLAFDLAGFTAVRREEGTVPLDGRLTLAGTPESLLLAGDLVVPGAELRIPESLPPEIVTLDVIEVGADAPAKPAGDDAAPGGDDIVALDVGVTIPGRVFVRGRGLTSEWRGALRIVGTVGEPQVLGELTLVRGTFDLAGKTLSLEQGSVRFDEGQPNDPLINVLATTPVEDATARVELSGRASKPEVALSSEPPLPTDEIMARILFGTPVAELTPVQALQLASGLATLSGVGGGAGVLDTVRRGLGADILEVRANEGGPATVRAGKYVAENVMLYLEQGAAAGSTRATLEAEVTDHISVETDIGADARGSIGINVKTDY